MRINMQIDDGEPTAQPAPGAAPTAPSDGGAAPPASGPPDADALGVRSAIDAGPPPAYLLEALGATPQAPGASTEAFDGGAAPADGG
jgi:hypothetical protein